VTEGAAPIKSSSGTVKIPLMNEAVLLPRGKKLVVKLGAASADDVYHLGIPIYAGAAPQGASIKIGSETLKLSFLKHTVSSSVRGMAATVRIGTCSWADEALSKLVLSSGATGESAARLVRRALRHGRGGLDVLPAAGRVHGAGLGRADAGRVHDAREGVRSHDAPSGQGRDDPGRPPRRDARGRARARRPAAARAPRRDLPPLPPGARATPRGGQARRDPFPAAAVHRPQGVRRSTTSSGRASSSAKTRCSSSSGTRSWLDDENRADSLTFLERIGAGYVVVDAPRSDTAKNLVPTVVATTSPTAYVRFHGRNLGTMEQARRLGGRALRLPLLRRGARRVDGAAARARLPVRAGVRLLQQQRLVGGSRQPARARFAGRDERPPAAEAPRREPDRRERWVPRVP